MKRGLLYIICLLFVATSCLDEHRFGVVSGSKDEVKFSAELKKGVQTRTLYGEDNQATNIKVKWVDGDKVMVFGTTCVPPESENQMGEYTIKIAGENAPNNDNDDNKNMSIADDLVKIEEVGVRWGSAETSDFVAVYPSDNAAFQFNSSTGVVTASTSISATQNYVFSDEMVQKTLANGTKINVWEGTHFANDATNPSMRNAIMYARTDDVKNGNPVSLSFEPFSTVLKFRFEGFESLWSTDAEAYIQSITLKAPAGYNIAGDFDIAIPRNDEVSADNPVTATAKGNNSNTITINTIKQGGSYLKVAANQAVEFNVFTLPLNGLTITGDETTPIEQLWTVTIQVQGVDPLTYKLLPVDDADGNAKTYTLVPGLIHKVKVPKMISNKVPEWNPENWITQIPPPVYISELSIPGSWYSAHSDYQNNTDLAVQYKAGIRAFNIDCRLSYERVNSTATQGQGNLRLVVAGTDKFDGVVGTNFTPGDLVLDKLKTIADLIPDDEYVVVVLTIAEKPVTRSGILADYTFGNVDPAQVIPAIEKMLEENAEALSLYTTEISSMTTVDDVLGSMIVKINTNNSTISNYTYPNCSLVSFASMAMSAWNTSSDNITDLGSDYYTKMQTAPIYWGNAQTDLTYYYHQAQRTTTGVNSYDENGNLVGTNYSTTYQVNGVPTLQMRKDAIKNIVDMSKSIYDSGSHNGWFQLGLGGYTKNNDYATNSQSDVANELNDYVNDLILNKMDSDPSPVGIVLMNHCTSDRTVTDENGVQSVVKNDGIDLVKSIIAMNGKFYLNRLGNDVVTGGDQNQGTQDPSTRSTGHATIGYEAF